MRSIADVSLLFVMDMALMKTEENVMLNPMMIMVPANDAQPRLPIGSTPDLSHFQAMMANMTTPASVIDAPRNSPPSSLKV